jgi:hypothetical protein
MGFTRLFGRLASPISRPTKPPDRAETTTSKSISWFARLGPIGLVLAPVILSAIELRSELTYVPTLNDSALHSEMVRYAATQFQAGHFPLDVMVPLPQSRVAAVSSLSKPWSDAHRIVGDRDRREPGVQPDTVSICR